MLEFKKSILLKVSFDMKLFENELRKAIIWLQEEEARELKKWCEAHFGGKYLPIISKCYSTLAA